MDLVSCSNHLHQWSIYHSSQTNMKGLENLDITRAWPGLAMLTSVVVVVVTGLAWGRPAPGISETDTLLKISPSLII